MPKRRRRSFTPQFKAQVVLEVLSGLKSQAEVARQHKDQGLTPAALRRAMRRGRRPEVRHSDQGVQYAATAHTELLAGRGVAISMAAVGKPEENGFAERLISNISSASDASVDQIDACSFDLNGPSTDGCRRGVA
jgi:transposase InsO family protein